MLYLWKYLTLIFLKPATFKIFNDVSVCKIKCSLQRKIFKLLKLLRTSLACGTSTIILPRGFNFFLIHLKFLLVQEYVLGHEKEL